MYPKKKSMKPIEREGVSRSGLAMITAYTCGEVEKIIPTNEQKFNVFFSIFSLLFLFTQCNMERGKNTEKKIREKTICSVQVHKILAKCLSEYLEAAINSRVILGDSGK